MPKTDRNSVPIKVCGTRPNPGVMLRPWTLQHPAFTSLTPAAQLAYIHILASTGHIEGKITSHYLNALVRKNHRDSLIAAGLIVQVDDTSVRVIQPADAYTPLVAS